MLLLLFSTLPLGDPSIDELVDNVDLIELNHHYSSRGGIQVDQLILYKWKNTCLDIDENKYRTFGLGYEVIDFITLPQDKIRVYKTERDIFAFEKRWAKEYPNQPIPEYVPRLIVGYHIPQYHNGEYVVRVKHFGYSRRIYSQFSVESWTTLDPEVMQRSLVPIEKRIRLKTIRQDNLNP